MKHVDQESLLSKNSPSGDPPTSSSLLDRLEDASLKSHKFTIKCSYCNTLLPAYAKFCSFCGKRVKQKKNEEMETHTKHSSDEEQESDVPVRQMRQGPRLSRLWASFWHAVHSVIQKMRRK